MIHVLHVGMKPATVPDCLYMYNALHYSVICFEIEIIQETTFPDKSL